MKNIIKILLLILLFPSMVRASDWRYVLSDTVKGIEYDLFLDVEGAKKVGNLVYFTQQMLYDKPVIIDEDILPYNESVMSYVMDCNNRTYKLLRVEFFGDDPKPQIADYSVDAPWHSVMPDKRILDSFELLCSFDNSD